MITTEEALAGAGLEMSGFPPSEEKPAEEVKEDIKETVAEKPKPADSSLKEEIKEEKKQPETVVEEKSGEPSFGEFVDTTPPTEETKTEKPVEQATFDFVTEYNEKFNTEYKSEEEIVKSQERPKYSEASESLDKFLKANPKSNVIDWVNAIAVDYTKVPAQELIIQDFVSKGYSRNDAEFAYNQKFGEQTIDKDEMEESEIKSLEVANRMKKIDEESFANNIRSDKQTLKETYQTSMDSYKPSEKQGENTISKEDKDAFTVMADESIKSLETISIPLPDNKAFNFSPKEFLEKNKDNLRDIEKAFGLLQKDDGNWDTTKFFRLLAIDANLGKIGKTLFTQGRGKGAKETTDLGKNSDYDNTKTKEPENKDNTESETVDQLAQAMQNRGMRINF